MFPHLLLASASHQRKTLLAGLGLSFAVVPSGIDEQSCSEREPRKRARVLAELKARDIAAKNPGAWIIGCDTLVVTADGELLEKPVDEADARRMIGLQSGRTSVVHSGLALIAPDGQEWSDVSTSFVGFRAMTSADIDWWIGTGMWKDRSGSFQIDGLGQLMIAKMEGDFTGVVGLPVFLLGELCREAKAPFLR